MEVCTFNSGRGRGRQISMSLVYIANSMTARFM